jgi:hypothetical protein
MAEKTSMSVGDGGVSTASVEVSPNEDLGVEQISREQIQELMTQNGFSLILTARHEVRSAGFVGSKDITSQHLEGAEGMFFGYDGQKIMVIKQNILKNSIRDGFEGYVVDKEGAEKFHGSIAATRWSSFGEGLNDYLKNVPETSGIALSSQVCTIVISEIRGKKDLDNPDRNIVIDVIKGLEETGMIQMVKKDETK